MKKLWVSVVGSVAAMAVILALASVPSHPVQASTVAPFTLNVAPFARKALLVNAEPGATRACIPCCAICECEPASVPDGVCSWAIDGPPFWQCVANTGIVATIGDLTVPPEYLSPEGQLDTAKMRSTIPDITIPTGTIEWMSVAELHARRAAKDKRDIGLIVDNVRIR